MYRYYQNSEKSAWIPVEDKGGDSAEVFVRDLGARKLTILAIDKANPDGVPPDSLRYRGPLYFDIDVKDDLTTAIDSGRRLAKKLSNLGVPEDGMEIYCSGSKGLHILIPMTLFSQGRPQTRLPQLYKEMARHLFVHGMDFQVYSGKKGNSFRLQNLQRDDGNYRVRISHRELAELTEAQYKLWVSGPREGTWPVVAKTTKAPQLEIMFTEAKKSVNAKPTAVRIPITDVLLNKIKSEVPPCVENLVDYRGIRPGTNFNEVALQLSIYLNQTKMSDDLSDSLIARMSDNGDSSKYTTPQMRHEHVTGAWSYQRYNPMQFSCPAMRGMLSKRPCDGCVLENEADAGNVNDILAQIGMLEKGDGYYAQGAKGEERMISNFTLKATNAFLDVPPDGTTPRREGTVMDILSRGQFVASVIMREASWNSKSAFLKEIQGLTDLIFLGSDTDVQKIKLHVFKEFESMGEVMQVHSAGIHVETVSKSKLMTYVEPNMSVNELRVKDTHRLADDVISPPQFADVATCKKGDNSVDVALNHLCKVNAGAENGKILGWFIACHLKQHLMIEYKQFPLLNVWGNAGSGKTAIVQIMSFLGGMDMLLGDGAVNATNATNYAALHYLSSTTTVPRVMEEYNRSKMARHTYLAIGEMFKQAWSADLHTRGTKTGGSALRGGGGTVKIPMSSPVAVISEQSMDMPALVERSVQVMVSKAGRQGKTDNYRGAKKGKECLLQFGKALMVSSLLTDTESVAKLIDDQEPFIHEDMDDRPRYGLQVALMGLAFGLQVAKGLELTKSVDSINRLRADVIESIDAQIQLVAKSEMDAVISTLGEMVAESSVTQDKGPYCLESGKHYVYDDATDTLSIAVTLCHIRYRKFVSAYNGIEPAIGTASMMATLLRVEDYFMKTMKSPVNRQEMHVLSLSKMQSKGIDVSLFSM